MNVLYYRWGRLTYCEVSVTGNINFDGVRGGRNLLWGICYTSVKGGNINFDECVVLQVGAV